MARYRWLDDTKLYEYRGRARPEWKGRRCRIVQLPQPGTRPANCIVEFLDTKERCVVPHGVLRKAT